LIGINPNPERGENIIEKEKLKYPKPRRGLMTVEISISRISGTP